jgi:hypothetical protein
VSDQLWARVEEVRRAKTRGGGPKNWDRVDLLGGLLECVCGRVLRNDRTFADGRHRKLHANPCDHGVAGLDSGMKRGRARCSPRSPASPWTTPRWRRWVAALGSSQQPVAIGRARVERQIRELALDHAGGALGDDAYLARLKALREQRDGLTEHGPAGPSGQRAVEWLRALSESVHFADVPEEKADLMHAIYERITVAGPEIVGVRLTTAAYAHGLALPEKVVMARPTGVGHALTAYRMPIEGRDEWLAAAARHFA